MMNSTYDVFIVSPLKQIVRLYITLYLWGGFFYGDKYKYRDHREKTNKRVSKIQVLPLPLQYYLQHGVILLEHAYKELLQWKKIHVEFSLPNLISKSGHFLASRYLTCEGHFSDVAWVKHLIYETEINIEWRFNFACVYCFENEIFTLWQQMKDNDKLPYGGNLAKVRHRSNRIVALWIHRLENKLDEFNVAEDLPVYNVNGGSFSYMGLIKAVLKGHDQAVCYFWNHLSDTERNDLFENKKLFRILRPAARSDYHKIVHFLYSQLSYQQKCDLLTVTIQDNYECMHVWNCLLESPITHSSILQEIVNFRYPVPVVIYEEVIFHLSLCIGRLNLPMFRNAFETLWRKIPVKDQIYVIDERGLMLRNLVNRKEIGIVGLIIKAMPIKIKDKCLFEDWNAGGITNLATLCAEGEYELLQQYLSFFLIHFDEASNTVALRKDALDILKKFIKSPHFIYWIVSVPDLKKKEVHKVIDALQSSLSSINCILSKIEETTLVLSEPTMQKNNEPLPKIL